MPTRGRPDQSIKAIENVFATTKGHDVEMIVVAHPDPKLSWGPLEAEHQNKLKVFLRDCTAIQGWNFAASHASGSFLKVWDDDLVAHPGWLDEVEKTWIDNGSPDIAYIGLWDKHPDVPDKLFTRAIGTRKFFKEVCGGVLTIPAYRSWYDDTEKFERAKAAGCAIYCPTAIIEHHHPAYGYPTDATYELAKARQINDADIFQQRKAAGFPNDYDSVF